MNTMDYQELKLSDAVNSSRVVISFIKEIQKLTTLSKCQIAAFCKIPLSTFYRMCSGQVYMVSIKTFKKLFQAYCLFCCLPSQDLVDDQVKQMVFERPMQIQRLP